MTNSDILAQAQSLLEDMQSSVEKLEDAIETFEEMCDYEQTDDSETSEAIVNLLFALSDIKVDMADVPREAQALHREITISQWTQSKRGNQ